MNKLSSQIHLIFVPKLFSGAAQVFIIINEVDRLSELKLAKAVAGISLTASRSIHKGVASILQRSHCIIPSIPVFTFTYTKSVSFRFASRLVSVVMRIHVWIVIDGAELPIIDIVIYKHHCFIVMVIALNLLFEVLIPPVLVCR